MYTWVLLGRVCLLIIIEVKTGPGGLSLLTHFEFRMLSLLSVHIIFIAFI